MIYGRRLNAKHYKHTNLPQIQAGVEGKKSRGQNTSKPLSRIDTPEYHQPSAYNPTITCPLCGHEATETQFTDDGIKFPAWICLANSYHWGGIGIR